MLLILHTYNTFFTFEFYIYKQTEFYKLTISIRSFVTKYVAFEK